MNYFLFAAAVRDDARHWTIPETAGSLFLSGKQKSGHCIHSIRFGIFLYRYATGIRHRNGDCRRRNRRVCRRRCGDGLPGGVLH